MAVVTCSPVGPVCIVQSTASILLVPCCSTLTRLRTETRYLYHARLHCNQAGTLSLCASARAAGWSWRAASRRLRSFLSYMHAVAAATGNETRILRAGPPQSTPTPLRVTRSVPPFPRLPPPHHPSQQRQPTRSTPPSFLHIPPPPPPIHPHRPHDLRDSSAPSPIPAPRSVPPDPLPDPHRPALRTTHPRSFHTPFQ